MRSQYHRKPTAEERLKDNYPRIFRWSAVVAAALHVAAFITPLDLEAQPYQLREDRPIEVVPPIPDYKIPPPPKEEVKPEIPVEIMPSDEADVEATMSPNVFDVDAPPEIPPAPSRPDYFIAYDTAPQIIYQVQPKYPEFARMSELEGLVGLMVGIDESGKVLEAKIVQSMGGVLDKSAREAVMQWKFKPALQRDIPVPARIYIPVRFQLKN